MNDGLDLTGTANITAEEWAALPSDEPAPAIVERCPGCGTPLAPGADSCGRYACVEGMAGESDCAELEAWLDAVQNASPAVA